MASCNTVSQVVYWDIYVWCRYPYITVVLNFSQMWALYCLVQFYNVTHQKLQPIKPLAKFISFKAIVFATWWQGVGIALVCNFGILPKDKKFQTGLQDLLICLEVIKHRINELQNIFDVLMMHKNWSWEIIWWFRWDKTLYILGAPW